MHGKFVACILFLNETEVVYHSFHCDLMLFGSVVSIYQPALSRN
jgi:hypothetical protein